MGSSRSLAIPIPIADGGTGGATPAAARMALAVGEVFGEVDVRKYATGGDGTIGNPWTGWDTAITWSSLTKYSFATGHYRYSTTLSLLAMDGIELAGQAGVFLKYTGTGDAILIGNTSGASGVACRANIHDLDIDGNGTAAYGLRIHSCHFSRFSNLNFRNIVTAAIVTQWSVDNEFSNCTNHQSYYTSPLSTYGLILDRASGSYPSGTTTCVFNACIFTGSLSHGVWLKYAQNCVFNGGASENAGQGGSGVGLQIDSTSLSNQFNGFDVEGSAHGSMNIDGVNNLLAGSSTYDYGITLNGVGNVIVGGNYVSITITASAHHCAIIGVAQSVAITNGSINTFLMMAGAKSIPYATTLDTPTILMSQPGVFPTIDTLVNSGDSVFNWKNNGKTADALVGYIGTNGDGHATAVAGDFIFRIAGRLLIDGGLAVTNYPTSDPHVAGRMWRSGNNVMVSTG